MPNITIDRPPTLDDPRQVAEWTVQQIQNLQRALNTGLDSLQLVKLHVEPGKVIEGMVVLADGTNWDPGSGEGFYGYTGGAWVFLG